MPVTGTEYCGLPRDGVRLSFTGSHVHIDGCRLKSVNHSHPDVPSSTGLTRSSTRILSLTAHLHCTLASQQRFRGCCFLRRTFNPYAVITAAEARVVSDSHRETRHS